MPFTNLADLGDKVIDEVTGYEGVVTSVARHLTGCNRCGVEARTPELGSTFEWFDITRLRVIERGAVSVSGHMTAAG